jgi:PAS domain S-box-containing protein
MRVAALVHWHWPARGESSGRESSVAWPRYAVALGAVVLALLCRLSLDPLLGKEAQPFAPLYIAVALVAWWGGVRPALLAMLLGWFVDLWLVIPPRGGLALRIPGFAEMARIITYFFVTGTIVGLIELLHRAEQRAKAGAQAALRKQAQLEEEIRQHRLTEAALKASQAALRKRELALAQAGQMAQLGAWDIEIRSRENQDANPLCWSDEVYRIFGYEPGSVAVSNRLFFERVPAEDHQAIREALAQAIRGRRPFSFQHRIIRPDGTERIVEEHAEPLFDRHTRRLRLVGAVQDVTEREQAREALASAQEELEAQVQERTAKLRELVGELEHLSYTLAHDMRAPLRAMHGFTVLLQKECGGCTQPRPIDFYQRIIAGAERLDRLIVDALNYTKLVHGQLALQPVELSRLLRGLLDTYPNLQAPKAQIHLAHDLPRVIGNEALLTQCFSNLLGNAVKFVASGTTPQVRVWAQPQQETIRIWVEDNGIGIAPEFQQRIFDLFQRLHAGYEGTGLGLALVRKAAERMGGKVGVESAPGQGSRFWVDLRPAPAPDRPEQ